jgi:hypothetical protein
MLVFQVNRRTGSTSAPDGLATQSTAGGPVHRLAAAGPCAKSPRWAPDGAVVFFISCQRSATGAYRFGHDDLAMVSPDGSHFQVVVPNLVEAASLRWLAAPPPAPTRTATSSPTTGVVPTSSAAGTTTSRTQSSSPAPSAHKASSTAATAVAAALVALTGAGQVLTRRRRT